MEPIELMVIASGAMAAGAGLLALSKPRREMERQRFELRFPSEVTDRQVRAVLAGVAGMRRGAVAELETVVTIESVRYYVALEERDVAMLRGHLKGVMPGARLQEAEPRESTDPERFRIWAGGWDLLLRSEEPAEAAASLLGVMSEVLAGEKVTYIWRLSPGTGARLPEGARRSADNPFAPDEAKALRIKHQGPLLAGELVVEVLGQGAGQAVATVNRIAGLLRQRLVRGQIIVDRGGRLERMVRAIKNQRPGLFSSIELAGLIGWPVGSPNLANLELGTAPQLMAQAAIPSGGVGRRFGSSTWPGMEGRQLVQPPVGALSHTLLLGPTGSGKSTLLTELAADDMRQGRGLVLIDLKGDTAEALLGRVPGERLDDVIVLDPAALDAVPGLKVFAGSDPELAADQLITTFKGIFKDSWGVRSDQYLRLGFVTLAHDPAATLADLNLLFTSEAFRSRLVGGIDDPMLKSAWATYEQMKPGEQATHLASPLRKVNEVVGRKIVRAVLAQAEPRFDMSQVLTDAKVVVVSLSPGRLGSPASRLIGALVVFEVYKAVLARQRLPEGQRPSFGLYIDEPKVLTQGSPLPIDSSFELFRGLGVGITLAAQSITQLDRDWNSPG